MHELLRYALVQVRASVMKGWWTGAVLVALGLGWVTCDRALRTFYPLSWGGPNIGGAVIWFAAWMVAGAGLLVMVLAGLVLWFGRPRPRRSRVLLPVGVDAVVVVALLAAHVTLPGDVGPDGYLRGVNGQVGVTVAADGGPVLLLEVCRGAVDSITVVGPNRGDQPNEVFAQLHAAVPVTAPLEVALLDPPAGWSGAPASLPLGSQEFLIASAEGRQSVLGQVDFSSQELAEVAAAGSDAVAYSDYDPDSQRGSSLVITDRAGLHEWACAGLSEY